jgi:hypothetical protein
MGLFRHRRPTRSPSSVRPSSPYQLAMPAQQRLRTNEERLLALAAQESARRGKEHPVSLVQARMGDLAAKNRQLVSKHHDLELLELARAHSQRRNRKHTPKQQVQQRHEKKQPPSTRVQKEPTLRPRTSSDPPGRIRRIYVPHGFTRRLATRTTWPADSAPAPTDTATRTHAAAAHKQARQEAQETPASRRVASGTPTLPTNEPTQAIRGSRRFESRACGTHWPLSAHGHRFMVVISRIHPLGYLRNN